MYKIIDGRGTGKTSRLLLLAKETGASVVCSNPEAMKVKAYAYGLTGIDCVSYEEFFEHIQYTGEIPHYLIDDVDEMFKQIAGANIIGYTISDND